MILISHKRGILKYPNTLIYLDRQIPEDDITSLANSHWCDINKKRWVHAADIYGFGTYLLPKIIFKPPFKLVRSEITCISCKKKTPVVAIEAASYVPISVKGHDLVRMLALFLENEIDNITPHAVYLTNVREYPPEFLKRVRMASFLFRKHTIAEDNEYFANACSHCKAPIEDFLLFYEQDGPLARCNPCPPRSESLLNYKLPLVCEAQFA